MYMYVCIINDKIGNFVRTRSVHISIIIQSFEYCVKAKLISDLPDKDIRTSLMTYSQIVLLGYNWSIAASCSSLRFKLYMPSSAPIRIC
jgi:hypothetical protein